MRVPHFDLSPCRLGSLSDLGHCAYERRTCPQCAGAYASCGVCEATGSVSSAGPVLCPGCRHRAVLAAIAAGEVVFPDAMQVSRPGAPDGDPGSRPGLHWSPIQWQAQAGELRAVAQAGAVGELSHVDHGSNQAATVDAGSAAVYNAGESHNHLEALTSGDAAMASPVYVLVLPVDLAAMQTVLQALAPVLQSHATNGHREAEGGSPPRLPRKTYLSDTPCPHGHVWRDTGKVLRFRGNNQCVPCSGQRTPRAKALATTES